jgi:hypothetical protein
MSYIGAVTAAIHDIDAAHNPDDESVHIGLELVLAGWALYTRDQTAATAWDLLGNAAGRVATRFHDRPPILITLDEDPQHPADALAATLALVTAVAEHLDRCAHDAAVAYQQRWQWATAAARLRTAAAARP